jgi:hypothetical protein
VIITTLAPSVGIGAVGAAEYVFGVGGAVGVTVSQVFGTAAADDPAGAAAGLVAELSLGVLLAEELPQPARTSATMVASTGGSERRVIGSSRPSG